MEWIQLTILASVMLDETNSAGGILFSIFTPRIRNIEVSNKILCNKIRREVIMTDLNACLWQ
jgi:hypothetical protein